MRIADIRGSEEGDILIVDDDINNLQLLANLLTDAGYHVRPAKNGRLALRSVQAKRPALILLDIRMPELDGYQVCQALKSNEATRSIPVIFISASGAEADKIRGFQTGGVDYINKPFRPDEVLARVRTHLTLHRTQVELEAANAALRAARDALEEKVRARTMELEQQIEQNQRTLQDLAISQERYRQLFEDSPISLWEEDFSQVKVFFDELRASGVTDFRAFFENHPEAVLRCTELVRIVDVNQASLVLMEAEQKEALLAGLSHLFAVDALEIFRQELITLAQGDRRFESEIIHRALNGELKNIRLNLSVAPGSEHRLDRVLLSMIDITGRRRAEDALCRLNQELEERVVIRTGQLEAANRELEAFAYTVSHDLRAPLRHINGFIELLREDLAGKLNEKSLHYMNIITDAANRMGMLIDDLLSFSRMARSELSKTPTDLNRLVMEVIEELKPETGDREIRWRIDPLPVVVGDRAMLRVALVNLISNAIKFTRTRAQAEVEIGRGPERAHQTVVFVRDNGVGFDMRYADKLFGVFQRLHSAEEFEGTGIGLAIVRRIIHRHGGDTWAESEVDHGATFFFSLPWATG